MTLSIPIRGREDWWTSSGTNGWATFSVIGFLFGFYTLRFLVRPLMRLYVTRSSTKLSSSSGYGVDMVSGGLPVVTEGDLQRLFTLLDEDGPSSGIPWIPVVDKQSGTLSYDAKLREPEDGSPTEYLSTSLFRNCSSKGLKDFYMDSEYRLRWDKTFESYELLHADEKTGYEIGRFVKRFPFIRPREYVLAWRLWEGEDGSYYYFAKHCEHPQAPQSPMYSRVEHYMSGWRIRRDGNDCEIKMWHQEDTTSMAKMAFSYRIWNYMCDMERSLRKYRPTAQNTLLQIPRVSLSMAKMAFSYRIWNYMCDMERSLRKYRPTAQNTLLQIPRVPVQHYLHSVPAALVRSISCPSVVQSGLMRDSTTGFKKKRLSIKQSGKWMANGILVLGGAMFCARRSAPLGAKIAALYAINKLVKPATSVKPIRQHYPVL